MGEGIAGHDPDHQRLHPIAVFGDCAGKLIDNDLVVAFQLCGIQQRRRLHIDGHRRTPFEVSPHVTPFPVNAVPARPDLR